MKLFKTVPGWFDGLRPIPLLKVSEWADKNRYLTSESAAEPGLWRTDRTPYLRDLMDDLSPNSPITDVVIMKGVQLGFTEAGLNIVGCFMDISPCPIMYVMPTIELSKSISTSRVTPMIDHSPSLSKRVRPTKEKDSSNTILVKRFPGGILVLSGANSAASLRSRPMRVLILDEVDAYPVNVDNEGSPISLAEKRTSTFTSKKKVFKISTPKIEQTSVILQEYKATDQRKYHVPCPECGTMQPLVWDRLRWEKGKVSTVRYYCAHCDHPIEERHKTKMLGQGQWIADAPEKTSSTRVGYHMNSLYSPLGWLSWSDISDQWEKAQNDTNLMKVFVNTILGECWKEDGEAPEYMTIYNRREAYGFNRPPAEVSFITVGVDVQKDRLEFEVVGWCKGKRTYSIDYRILIGDTAKTEVWDQLALVVNETWTRTDGAVLPMYIMAVDTGYNTTHVYDFVRRFAANKVVPVKGDDRRNTIISPPKVVDTKKDGKKVGAVALWTVGVSLLKQELYGWLKQHIPEGGAPPPGYCHFPEYDQEHFKRLTAEELQVVINKKNFSVYQWVKKHGQRNEQLDTRIYARAAASVIGIDRFTDEIYDNMPRLVGNSKPKPRPKSDFWGK